MIDPRLCIYCPSPLILMSGASGARLGSLLLLCTVFFFFLVSPSLSWALSSPVLVAGPPPVCPARSVRPPRLTPAGSFRPLFARRTSDTPLRRVRCRRPLSGTIALPGRCRGICAAVSRLRGPGRAVPSVLGGAGHGQPPAPVPQLFLGARAGHVSSCRGSAAAHNGAAPGAILESRETPGGSVFCRALRHFGGVFCRGVCDFVGRIASSKWGWSRLAGW